MLKEFGRAIWIANGPEAVVAGFRYPTRMAVMQLADGGLFIWSPVALSDSLRTAIDALGPVRHIVEPNALHHLFLAEWQRSYPEATFHAPPGLRKKRPDIAFDTDLGDTPAPDWAGQIDQVVLRGNRITTEVVFFHAPSGTVLFTDLLQQIPPGMLSGWRAVVARLDRMTGPEPSVPRKFRIAFSDRRAARDAVGRILAWPAEQVLMAHGTPVTRDAHGFLRRAFRWLTG
jgi:hypothetical protein